MACFWDGKEWKEKNSTRLIGAIDLRPLSLVLDCTLYTYTTSSDSPSFMILPPLEFPDRPAGPSMTDERREEKVTSERTNDRGALGRRVID